MTSLGLSTLTMTGNSQDPRVRPSEVPDARPAFILSQVIIRTLGGNSASATLRILTSRMPYVKVLFVHSVLLLSAARISK